jgi:hypothetical protein
VSQNPETVPLTMAEKRPVKGPRLPGTLRNLPLFGNMLDIDCTWVKVMTWDDWVSQKTVVVRRTRRKEVVLEGQLGFGI